MSLAGGICCATGANGPCPHHREVRKIPQHLSSEHTLFPASRRQQHVWTAVWGPVSIVVTLVRKYRPT